jgi:hypothetical protein
MRKLLLLGVGLLLLASCDKEQQCSVCTTNIGGLETVSHQSDWKGSSVCENTQTEFKEYLEGIASTATAGTGISYSVTCVYE